MLSMFRSFAKGWMAFVLLGLVSIPFIFWGMGQLINKTVVTHYVAKVNGSKIMPSELQHAYEQAFQQRQSRLNGHYNPTQAQQTALKMQTLQQLIGRKLLLQQAQNDHLVASNVAVRAQIEQIPAFQSNGHFDYQQYKLFLNNRLQMTIPQFENEVRADLLMQQLQAAIGRSAFSTPREISKFAALVHQQRKVSWFILPLKHYKPSTPPARKAIVSYYQAHQKAFSAPETISLAYLRLDKKTLKKRVQETPQDLKEYYRTHESQYGVPPARKVAEILVKPSGKGTAAQAAARKKLEKYRHEAESSKNPVKTFAELARKYSDDAVSRRNGGSIGYVSRGQLPEKIDNAVFDLKNTGGIAGPIQTQRGWLLVQLLGKRAGAVKPYSAVKEQVAKDYRNEKAKDLYYKLDGKFANLTYENAGSLDAAAKALGLTIHKLSDVTRDQGTGIAGNPQVRKAAFSDSVLKQRQNSNPIKLGNEDAVVVRVSGVTPSKVKPLSKVKARIVSLLEVGQAKSDASKAAEVALGALRSGGKSMYAVASMAHVKVHGPAFVNRSDQKVPSALLTSIFNLAPAMGGKTRYSSVALQNGDQAVYALHEIKLGDVKKLPKLEQSAYARELGQLYANEISNNYVKWLRSKADIKIVKSNIQ